VPPTLTWMTASGVRHGREFEIRRSERASFGDRDRSDAPAPESASWPRAAVAAGRRIEVALEFVEHGWALFSADERLEYCNGVYRSMLAPLSSAELVGRQYDELIALWLPSLQFSSHEERRQFLATCRSHGRSPRVEFDVLARDGRRLHVLEQRMPDGGVSCTIMDRTEEERTASELRAALRESRAASAARAKLICSMSHALRTPLNSIMGFAQLLQRDRREPLTERHLPRVAQILEGGEQLVRVLDDLLALLRIEAGPVSIAVEPVDMAATLERVRALLQPQAIAKGVSLQLPPALAVPRILADSARLQQILMSLGANAMKYNRDGGSVRFEVSVPSAQVLRISVSDTGLGISQERQAHLFEPFSRAGQEGDAVQGTGLGLAITKRLAELMGGAVGFSSVSMQGSTFWVELPQAP
jgi:signal transduction histidine kinase